MQTPAAASYRSGVLHFMGNSWPSTHIKNVLQSTSRYILCPGSRFPQFASAWPVETNIVIANRKRITAVSKI